MSLRSVLATLLLPALASGCAKTPADVDVPWKYEATPTDGVITVLPTLVAFELPEVPVDDFLLDRVSTSRLRARRARLWEVTQLPDAVGTHLPGFVHRDLDPTWTGVFTAGTLPMWARTRLLRAIEGERDLDETLATIGFALGAVGADATLISWVDRVDVQPLTRVALPHELVLTDDGPLVVDTREEALLLDVHVSVALVRADGEVVLRHQDHEVSTVLSDYHDPRRAGRSVARQVAASLVRYWPDDPRLGRVERTR